MRYRNRVVLAVLALTLATNGLLLWVSYRGSSALLFRQIQSKVLSIAATTGYAGAPFLAWDRLDPSLSPPHTIFVENP